MKSSSFAWDREIYKSMMNLSLWLVEGERLVRVKSVGVCGSDLHWFSEGSIGDAKLEHRLVLGHEFAGRNRGGSTRGH